MSTITKQFTKDQLIAKAQEQIKLIRGLNLTLSAKEHVDMCSVLFEIALASLEAEREYKHHSVIAEQLAHVLSSMVVTDHQRAVISCAVDRLNNVSQLLQSCPSALLVPETLDYQGAKELYNYLMTEEETNATVNGWNACRAAMLQNGNSPAQSDCCPAQNCIAPALGGNSPVIPDGWVACSERMPDPESEYRICAYTPTPHEDVRFRFVPASLFKSVCRDATHWQYMLPPAAPQQKV